LSRCSRHIPAGGVCATRGGSCSAVPLKQKLSLPAVSPAQKSALLL
jgi:hypothetical protein